METKITRRSFFKSLGATGLGAVILGELDIDTILQYQQKREDEKLQKERTLAQALESPEGRAALVRSKNIRITLE